MADQDATVVEITLRDGMRFDALGTDGVAVSLDSDAVHGGSGAGLRPMELLLVALGGCSAMDVITILRKKRQEVTEYRVEVGGVQAQEYPHVFTAITMRHILHGSNLADEAVRRSIELSESKYCSAYAMLKQVADITSSFEIHPAAPPD